MTDEPKLPPHDAKAENALLGAILREGSRDLFADVAAQVDADDFYGYANQLLWRAFAALIEAGKPIDPVTLNVHLTSAGHIDDAGGSRRLVDLWDEAPAAANVLHYAAAIKNAALLRRLARLGREIIDAAFEGGQSPDDVAAMIGRQLEAIENRRPHEAVEIAKSIDEALAEWEERRKAGAESNANGIKTPWPRLNTMTNGLKRKALTILAARPSVGKTLTALNLIAGAADAGCRILFASIEQSRIEIVERMVAARAQVASTKFRNAYFEATDETRIVESTRHMADGWKLWIDDRPSQTVASIAADCRRLARRGGLDLCVVDFLGLLENDTPRDESYHYFGEMCRRLRAVAKDLGIAMVLLAQLNRKSEDRVDRRPQLSDLRDSGKIEEAADDVYLLHRPGDPASPDPTQMIEIVVAKQRNGPLGMVTLVHSKRYFELRELEHDKSRFGEPA